MAKTQDVRHFHKITSTYRA